MKPRIRIPGRTSDGGGEFEQRLQPAATLAQKPALLPEPPQDAREPKPGFDVAGLETTAKHRPEVRVLAFEAPERRDLVRADEARFGIQGEIQEIGGVARRGPPRVVVRREPVLPEVADRVEHPKPRFTGFGRVPDEAVVDERGHSVERVESELAIWVADHLGRLDRAATGEDREPREERPMRRWEELVAPGDRTGERLLPSG